MKKINREQVLLAVIFVLLIILTVTSFSYYEEPNLKILLLVSYVCVASFNIMIATKQSYWVLFMLSYFLLGTIPTTEALFLLPHHYGVTGQEALILYRNEGIFTHGGQISICLYGFLIPIIIVGIKINQWTKSFTK